MEIIGSVIVGDYLYTGWDDATAGVKVVDATKAYYGEILSNVEIEGVECVVSGMAECFRGCYNILTSPDIPDTIIDMGRAFYNCTSLITPPKHIPANVLYMESCFYNCQNIRGQIFVSNSPTRYSEMFRFAVAAGESLVIRPTSLNIVSLWQNIVAQNVTRKRVELDPQISYTFLSSRRLTVVENAIYNTTRGVRIDMLLDCGGTYALTGMSPSNGKLYAIDGTQITFPYYSPNLLRCYLIYEPSSQVPTNKLTIQIENINTVFNSLQVSLPSTATVSQFNRNSASSTTISGMIGAQINNMTSVILNPQGQGSFNDINNLLIYIYENITGNTLTPIYNSDKAQVNVLNENGSLDIKHYVTTANNIQVTTSKTLQNIITECYNALGT